MTPVMSFSAKHKASSKEIEADLGLIWQETVYGETQDGILFAECKSYNKFKQVDFDRMEEIAKQFPGAILAFCTLRRTLDPWEVRKLKRLAKAGLKYWKTERPINPVLILTGQELFHYSGAPHCWDGLSIPEWARERTHSLLALCNATQAIYLGLPHWQETWREQFEKKRKKRKLSSSALTTETQPQLLPRTRNGSMDVFFFLKERTKFIRYFYDTAGNPFRETIRKIEAGEDPFEPPYSEDGEPAFQAEWAEANTALEMLGRTCISMLSASLHLYFKTWEAKLHIEWEPGERKKAFANGFVQGYRTCFGEVLKLSWDECPVNFEILEQITLARNRDQHPEQITTLSVRHSMRDREKYPQPFFTDEYGKKLLEDPDMASISWMSPAVHVSREALSKSIDQVEALGVWLEERILAAKYPR